MIDLDIEQADFMFRRGRIALLTIGPFEFVVNTADEGQIGFGINLGRWDVGWMFGGREKETP